MFSSRCSTFAFPTLWRLFEEAEGGRWCGGGGYGYHGVRGLNQIQIHFSLSIPSPPPAVFPSLSFLYSSVSSLSHVNLCSHCCCVLTIKWVIFTQSITGCVFRQYDTSEGFPIHQRRSLEMWCLLLFQIQPNQHEIICCEQTDASSPPSVQKKKWRDLQVWIRHRQQRVAH